MGYMDRYKERVTIDGANAREQYVNATNELLRDSFNLAPNYQLVKINGMDYDARIILNDRFSSKADILFKPNVTIDIGSVISYNNKDWLTLDFYDTALSRKAKIELCNNVLRWKKDGVLYEEPCITRMDIQYIEEEKFVSIPDGTIVVNVQYNESTMKISLLDRFLFGRSAYQVTAYDDFSSVLNGTGYLALTMQRTELSDNDQVETQVHDNESEPQGEDWL